MGQLVKMANGVVPSCVSSHTFPKNTGNKNEYVCTKCNVYEFQLKEALDEIGSARMIIDILKKSYSHRQLHRTLKTITWPRRKDS
jgi:transposase-like protein